MRRLCFLALNPFVAVRVVALSALSLFITTNALADSFNATGDTYTRGTKAATNFGGNPYIWLQASDTTGFVEFSLDSLSGGVDEAYLRIPIRDVKSGGRISLYRVWGNFDELAITQNTIPSFGAEMASFNVTTSDIGRTLSVNVTDLVRMLVERGTNGIAFATTNAYVAFGTRESGLPIRLDVETSGSSSTGNRPPTIYGNPPDAVANSTYSFTPQASDPDGDHLTFSILNKPGWASFNTTNGRISGVPGDSAVGIHGAIRIVVSDGADSATLGPFDIEVAEGGGGNVTLSWTIPTRNTDGSQLTDLRSFRIEWTRSGSSVQGSVNVSNPSISTYVIENLAAGTYTFTIAAINSKGVSSAPSNRATTTIN
jgi:hypothetical protein